MTGERRRQLEPAFLLHRRPWRDTSRILELMTRDHGRITLFARGVRRPKSALRAVLQPFVPLLVSWTGRADGGTLTGAEAAGAAFSVPPAHVLPGFYLNELLLRLLPREDRHETLYDAYAEALRGLAASSVEASLRRFERVLLDELGYGPDLAREAGSGKRLEADRYYHFEPGRGVLAVREKTEGSWRGHELLAVARGELDDADARKAARGIYGAAIAHCLEGRGLASREVMRSLKRLETGGSRK
jgi:DNA repair protein RecO (recombination protein O)